MQRIMAARVSAMCCEVKRRKAFKQLILLHFPIRGAIACADGVGIWRELDHGQQAHRRTAC